MNNNNESLDKKQQRELKKQQKKLERDNQLHPLRYKKAGVRLTRAEVAKIKAGRKQLRADIKAAGIKKREDIEILEVAKGAYFDKSGASKLFSFLFKGRVLISLLIAFILLLVALFSLSEITKMRGHFSVNLTSDLFKKGFSISETLNEDGHVEHPTSYLKGDVLDNTPCISIAWIDKDVDKIDGSHNGKDYFAYTFYIENTGDAPASYAYALRINSQSSNVREAAWIMLFVDGKMSFFADATADGKNQTLPIRSDVSHGYRNPPFMEEALYPDKQFELIPNDISETEYYRLVALPFESESTVTSGIVENVEPGQVHKYTVVLWLEGDDPDCTDEIIGGHLGLEFNFELVE